MLRKNLSLKIVYIGYYIRLCNLLRELGNNFRCKKYNHMDKLNF